MKGGKEKRDDKTIKEKEEKKKKATTKNPTQLQEHKIKTSSVLFISLSSYPMLTSGKALTLREGSGWISGSGSFLHCS